MDEDADAEPRWSSWPDWLGDAVVLAQRGIGLMAQIQSDWEQMSVGDRRWTTDTIMNEVVNSWERWTPFLGEVIQHGVEGASQMLRQVWPEASADLQAWRSSLDRSPLGAAASTYASIGQEVTDRMLRGDYRSADAVEDFATLGGMWAKDMWRRVAEARRAADRADQTPGGSAEAGDEGSGAEAS